MVTLSFSVEFDGQFYFRILLVCVVHFDANLLLITRLCFFASRQRQHILENLHILLQSTNIDYLTLSFRLIFDESSSCCLLRSQRLIFQKRQHIHRFNILHQRSTDTAIIIFNWPQLFDSLNTSGLLFLFAAEVSIQRRDICLSTFFIEVDVYI